MSPEHAKEIVEQMRAHIDATGIANGRDLLFLYLYDEIERVKASMAGLSFLNAGIQPLKRIDQ